MVENDRVDKQQENMEFDTITKNLQNISRELEKMTEKKKKADDRKSEIESELKKINNQITKNNQTAESENNVDSLNNELTTITEAKDIMEESIRKLNAQYKRIEERRKSAWARENNGQKDMNVDRKTVDFINDELNEIKNKQDSKNKSSIAKRGSLSNVQNIHEMDTKSVKKKIWQEDQKALDKKKSIADTADIKDFSKSMSNFSNENVKNLLNTPVVKKTINKNTITPKGKSNIKADTSDE